MIESLWDDFFGPTQDIQAEENSSQAVQEPVHNGKEHFSEDLFSFFESVEVVFSESDASSWSSVSVSGAESVCQSSVSSCDQGYESNTNSLSSQCSCTSSTPIYCMNISPRRSSPRNKAKREKQKIKKKIKSEIKMSKAASDLKSFVYGAALMDFSSLHCDPLKCAHGGMCVQSTSIGEAIALRKSYWGGMEQNPISAGERREKLREILSAAFSRNEEKFVFKIGSRMVCERGYLTVLGILTQPGGRPAGSWTRTKIQVKTDPDDEKILGAETKQIKSAKANRSKFQNATAYIEYVAHIYGDTCPTAGHENVRALPYEDVGQFFEEYVYHCKRANIHPSLRAEKTTFRNAFRAKKDIRLLGCKGSFETCDICNHANDLLRDAGHALTREQREIVLRFKRLHLEQQGNERQFLADNILKCTSDFDKAGNPRHALIYSDGMTVMRGETPKLNRKRQAKGDKGKKIQNRVIGVEVYCGPVSEVFLYHTDDFVPGGSNIMIEIQRQAMIDLGALLNTEHGMALPRHIIFQFDNCGENKNKYMFAYFSLLVESGVLDQVDVNFMIVGHTHSSIDQYFSTLSGAIRDAGFIGSPQSLWNLFSKAHSSSVEHKRPKIQKQIRVFYDMKSALEPYINGYIEHYRIPFNFKITRVCGKAVMQYRLFSSYPTWLPRPPDDLMQTQAQLLDFEINEISLERLSIVGGQTALLHSLDLASVTADKLLDSNRTNSSFQTLTNTLPELHNLEARAIENQEQRMADEATNLSHSARTQALKARYTANQASLTVIHKALTRGEKVKTGYMVWLKTERTPTKKNPHPEPLPPIELLSPTPFSPALLLHHLCNNTKGSKKKSRAAQADVEAPPEEEEDEVMDVVEVAGEEAAAQAAPVVAAVVAAAAATAAIAAQHGIPPECRSAYAAAVAIREAAKNMLNMVDEGRVRVSKISEDFNHKSLILTRAEYDFYTEMADEVNVVRALHAEYEKAAPWQALPETNMSPGYIERCIERREQIARETEAMMVIAQKLLQKEGHGVGDDVDFITRNKETRAAKNKVQREANNEKKRLQLEEEAAAQSNKKSRGGATSNTAEPAARLDALCCCNECGEPVLERCRLCGYSVCRLHKDCAESHSHQLKRPSATCDLPVNDAPPPPPPVTTTTAKPPRGRKPKAAALPLTQTVTAAVGAQVPLTQREPVIAAATVQPQQVPLTQDLDDGAAATAAFELLVPLTQVEIALEEPLTQPIAAVATTIQPVTAPAPPLTRIAALESHVGVWPENSAAAQGLATKIVSMLVGESKKTKGVCFKSRLTAELSFAEYVRSGKVGQVAKYYGIDMAGSLVADDQVNKEWKRYLEYFMVSLLRKFEL